MKVKDLKRHEKNPRKITNEELERLKTSIDKYGDLSCIIFNIRTLKLAGGNQRSKVIPQDAEVKYTTRYVKPNHQGTVAEGTIVVSGENMKYREVDWSEKTEKEAMLAANKLGGTWDDEILRGHLLDLNVDGFDTSSIGFGDFEFDFGNVDSGIDLSEETDTQSDEQYIRETTKSFEEIPTERKDANVKYEKKTFDEVKEETEIKGKRYVIIIDCPNQDIKDSLKEKLEPEIKEAGAKIF